jgi:hypothetical protein
VADDVEVTLPESRTEGEVGSETTAGLQEPRVEESVTVREQE